MPSEAVIAISPGISFGPLGQICHYCQITFFLEVDNWYRPVCRKMRFAEC